MNELTGKISWNFILGSSPKKISKYSDSEHVKAAIKGGRAEEPPGLEKIKELDEVVERVNGFVEEYSGVSDENEKINLKEKIFIGCDEMIDILYGDDPHKEGIKKSLRQGKVIEKDPYGKDPKSDEVEKILREI